MRTADPVTVLEAEFRTLAPFLSPLGVVGFLRYDGDDDRGDRIQVYYVTQYTLAPQLIEKRTDVEFLIVARDVAVFFSPRPMSLSLAGRAPDGLRSVIFAS
jgi:hypothetical protein